MANRVMFHGSRAAVTVLAYRLAKILAGEEPDGQGIARGFLLVMGTSALQDIKQAFITKARGGTDEMGVTWPKLSKKYLAYGRRFGPGEQSALKEAAGLGKGHRLAPGGKKGLLSQEQLKRWRQIYGHKLNRLLLSLPEKQAKARAAQIAWTVVKKEGAKTKLEVYGNRNVEILRDTGILFNSLSPGVPDNVLQGLDGSVIVGTNVPYAASHQYGDKKRGIPRRQIFPDNDEQVPDVWWERWLTNGLKALEIGARRLYGGGAA